MAKRLPHFFLLGPPMPPQQTAAVTPEAGNAAEHMRRHFVLQTFYQLYCERLRVSTSGIFDGAQKQGPVLFRVG